MTDADLQSIHARNGHIGDVRDLIAEVRRLQALVAAAADCLEDMKQEGPGWEE